MYYVCRRDETKVNLVDGSRIIELGVGDACTPSTPALDAPVASTLSLGKIHAWRACLCFGASGG